MVNDDGPFGRAGLATFLLKWLYLISPRWGSLSSPEEDSPASSNTGVVGRGFARAMDGRAIFNFMMTEVPTSVTRCLEINKLNVDDIDFVENKSDYETILKLIKKEL